MWVRVQIASLCVDVSDAHGRANGNICVGVRHPTTSKRVLKFRTHETVSLARASEEHEMNLEHGHVEQNRNDDEAKRASNEMLHEQARRHSQIPKEVP